MPEHDTTTKIDTEPVAATSAATATESTIPDMATTATASLRKQTKGELFWEIFRFLLVGGTATLADYLLFWLLDGVLFPLLPFGNGWGTSSLVLATACGFLVGLLVNWVLSVHFVFRQVKDKQQASSKKSFFKFAVIGLVGLALTELGVLLLVYILPEITLFHTQTLLGTSWTKWLAKVVMTCLVLVWNYLGRKLFIFRS